MITLHLSKDWQMVWQISQHPSVIERVSNDEWEKVHPDTRRERIRQLVEDDKNKVLMVGKDGDIAGGFLFECKGDGVFEVHTMLLPNARGCIAIEAGKEAERIMFEELGATKLTSYCPMNNRSILFFALRCGFKKVGLAAMEWVKNGVKWPIEMVELNRKDYLCR